MGLLRICWWENGMGKGLWVQPQEFTLVIRSAPTKMLTFLSTWRLDCAFPRNTGAKLGCVLMMGKIQEQDR